MDIPAYGYILILMFSLVCLTVLDARKRLALFDRPRRSLYVIGSTVAVFLAWDIAGIFLGIFRTNPDYVTGLYAVSSNLPIEEFLLLTLISYIVLLAQGYLGKRS